jgi:hypothetical protein
MCFCVKGGLCGREAHQRVRRAAAMALPPPLVVGVAWALACGAAHAALAAALSLRARSRGVGTSSPSRLARLTPRERSSLANTAVAGAHAAVLFAGALACLAPRARPASEGLLLFPVRAVTPLAPAEAFWAAASMGYLAYDTAYAAAAGGSGRDMAVHHALGLLSWGALLRANVGGLYILWVHLAEARPATRALCACVCGAWRRACARAERVLCCVCARVRRRP